MISCQPQPSADAETLRAEIESYLAEGEGTYAVWFQHLDTPGLQFAVNEDTLFHTASTMKTPVMIELFRRADAGDFDLSDSIKVENRFFSIVDDSEFQLDLNPGGNDPIEAKAGEMVSLRDLNHAMITYSSNISTNLIMQLAGAEETTRTMRSLGAETITIKRGLFDMKAFYAGINNVTTAKDLGIIFEHIARGTAVSPKMDKKMAGVLKEQFYRDVIPGGLPEEAVVANKTGSVTGVVHDSGIVWLPDGQSYVLIFLSKNLPENRTGTETGARVSGMIYKALTR
jgi:beta-lactamase class A